MNCKICDCDLVGEDFGGLCFTCYEQQEDAKRARGATTDVSDASNASDAMAVPSGAVSVEAGELLAVQPKKERRKNTIRDGWIDRAYKAEFKLHELERLHENKRHECTAHQNMASRAMSELDAMRRLKKTAECVAFVFGAAIGAAVMFFLCH